MSSDPLAPTTTTRSVLSALPAASSLVPPYLGSDVVTNELRFSPTSASSMPPLSGPPPAVHLPAAPYPYAAALDAFGSPALAAALPAIFPGGVPVRCCLVCRTVRSGAVLCCAVLCGAVQCCAVRCGAIL